MEIQTKSIAKHRQTRFQKRIRNTNKTDYESALKLKKNRLPKRFKNTNRNIPKSALKKTKLTPKAHKKHKKKYPEKRSKTKTKAIPSAHWKLKTTTRSQLKKGTSRQGEGKAQGDGELWAARARGLCEHLRWVAERARPGPLPQPRA